MMVVATSTVVAAVPMDPPVAKFVKLIALLSVLPVFVRPAIVVAPAFNVPLTVVFLSRAMLVAFVWPICNTAAVSVSKLVPNTLPAASILASGVPVLFCSWRRSAPVLGVAPPRMTATGVVALAIAVTNRLVCEVVAP